MAVDQTTSPLVIAIKQLKHAQVPSHSFCIHNNNLQTRNLLLTHLTSSSLDIQRRDSRFRPLHRKLLQLAALSQDMATLSISSCMLIVKVILSFRSSSSWRSVVWRTSTFRVHLQPFSIGSFLSMVSMLFSPRQAYALCILG